MRVKIQLRPPTRSKRFKSWFDAKLTIIKEHLVTVLLMGFSMALILIVASSAIMHFFFGADIPFIEMKNTASAQYWGQLGDFIGGMLNPILSFSALMAVLFSLHLQKKDLARVRQETIEANLIQNSQTAIYRQQGVESSLLSLIELHCKITDEVVIMEGDKRHIGRYAFKYLADELKASLKKSTPVNEPKTITETFSKIRYDELPANFYKKHAPELSRYMRSTFQVLKFIDSRVDAFDYSAGEESLNPTRSLRRFMVSYREKREFSSIFRAQFDQRELQLIFLNLLTPEGEGLKYYVEKYSLLKGMNISLFRNHISLLEKVHAFAFADYEEIDLSELYTMDKKHQRKNKRAAFQRSTSKNTEHSGE